MVHTKLIIVSVLSVVVVGLGLGLGIGLGLKKHTGLNPENSQSSMISPRTCDNQCKCCCTTQDGSCGNYLGTCNDGQPTNYMCTKSSAPPTPNVENSCTCTCTGSCQQGSCYASDCGNCGSDTSDPTGATCNMCSFSC